MTQVCIPVELENIYAAEKLLNSVDNCISKLKQFGFKQFFSDNCTHAPVFINQDMKVVVKRPYLMSGKEIPQHAIPTKVIEAPVSDELAASINWSEEGLGPYIVIQPLADLSNQSAAYGELRDAGVEGEDFYRRNVAHYNGKAVLIDW